MTARSAAGFSLTELLIAAALTTAVIAVTMSVVSPAQGLFQAQPELADMQQRLRVAVEAIQSDVMMAGAGVTGTTPGRGPLLGAFAPVLPYRVGDIRSDPDANIFYRADTLTVVFVPATIAQAAVQRAHGGWPASVEAAFNCGAVVVDRLCGFTAGMRVLVLDPSGRWDTGTVSSVGAADLQVETARPLSSAYASGNAAVAEVVMHTYSLKVDAARGTSQLVRFDGHVTELPMVENVIGLEFQYFGNPVPPALLPDVDLASDRGPWTTYGPKPPPLDLDDPADTWGAGENCTFAVIDGMPQPRLATLSAGGGLVRLQPSLLTDGPWCPDALSALRYDADLLRIRRVRVAIRVQVGSALLRGARGALFSRGGTASAAERLVPDQEIRFDVTPRNLGAGR